MNLDDELRGTLLGRADEAPSGADTLDGVRVRARRLAIRRNVGLAGVAALAVVAIGIGIPSMVAAGRQGSSSVAPAEPSTSPSAVPPRLSTVALIPPTSEQQLRFPLNPGWTPPGLGQPTVGRNVSHVRLWYGEGPSFLMASVGAELDPPGWEPTTTQPTTVGSRPATLFTGTSEDRPAVRITWQLPDGRWVDLQSGGQITTAQLGRYADNLQSEPMPPPPLPFTLALAPQGFQVAFQEIHPIEFHYCLAAPADLQDEGRNWICLGRNEGSEPRGGDPVQVGPDPGQITRDDDLVTVTVFRPGFEFSVRQGKDGPLSDEDLIRLAAGLVKS